MLKQKEYIGDGASVAFDGYHIILTAENGIYATDTVALEPEVLAKFLKYVKRLEDFIKQDNKGSENE